MKQTRRRPGPQTARGPPGHGSPRRTTAGRIASLTQKRAEESSGGRPSGSHSAGAPGGRGGEPAGSTGGQPHQGRPGPGPRDPRATPPPSKGPTEPGGPDPARQPPRASQHPPEHPALDIENHQRTSGQVPHPPAGSVAGGNRARDVISGGV
ncbi:basic proline-rich protein-like [Brienomyrus brachyistius]|uniref:basic proline-rich protein-like n=1 Tax=Brienomyrus brachyistius TaxID=42636 RepID=UPI0020B1CBBA|nr:basic proline-rich protein-like [Brienomyrus brachyistius]